MQRNSMTGIAAIAFAILFNIPYALLASIYDYPDVLRRPAGEALDLFAAGGSTLIFAWHGFALAALALIPMSIALSVTPSRIANQPGLTIGAAIAGSLAGFAQAVGLSRWVFVVPGLARSHASPDASPTALVAAERAFELLNAYGGVAIGEHLGQLLTALFVCLLAAIQSWERQHVTSMIGFVAAAMIALGTGEGLAIAIDSSGEMFALTTIVGFFGLTFWLIATGIGLVRLPAAD